MTRLGVFGGTFDPIHNGHLFIAEEAAEELGLDRMLIVPARDPPHRQAEPSASAEDRLAMVKLAIAGNPRFEASRIELERDGPSYTVDTLAALRERHADTEIVFIIGMDSVPELPRWHDPEGILRLAHLVAVQRGGRELADLSALEGVLPSAKGRVTLISHQGLEISATDVRQRLEEGRSVRYLVPDRVIEYIQSRGLYRAG